MRRKRPQWEKKVCLPFPCASHAAAPSHSESTTADPSTPMQAWPPACVSCPFGSRCLRWHKCCNEDEVHDPASADILESILRGAAKARDRRQLQQQRRKTLKRHRRHLLRLPLAFWHGMHAPTYYEKSAPSVTPVVRHISSGADMPLTIIKVGLSAALTRPTPTQAKAKQVTLLHMIIDAVCRQPASALLPGPACLPACNISGANPPNLFALAWRAPPTVRQQIIIQMLVAACAMMTMMKVETLRP